MSLVSDPENVGGSFGRRSTLNMRLDIATVVVGPAGSVGGSMGQDGGLGSTTPKPNGCQSVNWLVVGVGCGRDGTGFISFSYGMSTLLELFAACCKASISDVNSARLPASC